MLIYFVIINIVAYAVMGIDKKRAKSGEWRISEKTIWTITIIGGATGSWVGMSGFRHKTKHIQFKYGVPLLSIVQIGLLVYYFQS
ncbi:DUF1294 domain-containing protein [Radiobacillus sp. PE A8.2]|uniref:DUF1294 domain-containing protein n=1 Tax=Radiobacillus sp. PE A8.2 TaxID=3380349 RepID=UPI003890F9C4